jgi:Secretion system C-terminal sorting domain
MKKIILIIIILNFVGANATVASFYATQQSAEVAKYYEVDSLLSQGNTTLAQTKNNNATANNNITQTHKTYNNVYLSGVTSATYYATLQTLANLCPTTHGNAVFEARALLNMVSYSNMEYSDSCNEASSARMGYFEDELQGIAIAENIQANLFPNPNNGEFTLAYDLKNVIDGTVTITDITGKAVYSTQISNENNLVKINTDGLKTGMYFIQLNNKSNLLWTSKILINN